MELLREITEEYSTDVIPIVEAISTAVRELKMIKKGGLVTDKMVKDFMKSNKNLVAASAMQAIASYKQYKTNKRGTVTFFAKSPYDKKIIKTIVDSMIKSKAYKIHRTRYAQGGKYYELRKLKTGY